MPQSPLQAEPEPISADPPHAANPPLLTQSWLDLAFLHWAADPADVAPLLPAGTRPDTLDGVTYVGLVAFRMHRVGWFRLPGVPYLGSFPETNVRLYSVDARGAGAWSSAPSTRPASSRSSSGGPRSDCPTCGRG